MIRCKLLTENHIIVTLQINHPTYGIIEVDSFQRTETSILEDVANKSLSWRGESVPIVGSTEVLLCPAYEHPVIFVELQWDFLLPKSSEQTYKQHERYEVLFWIENKLIGRINRDNLSCCLTVMNHNMDHKRFDGIAVYDCGELVSYLGTKGSYEYGPPFSPKETKFLKSIFG